MSEISRYHKIATSDFRTTLANVLTAETDLNSIWLPPGFIGREPGDGVEISALLIQAANTNVKTSKLYWGSGTPPTVAGVGTASSGSYILMRARIYNVAPGIQSSESQTLVGPTGISILQFKNKTFTLDLTKPIQVRISGQSDAAVTGDGSDDLTGGLLKATYVPAGAVFSV